MIFSSKSLIPINKKNDIEKTRFLDEGLSLYQIILSLVLDPKRKNSTIEGRNEILKKLNDTFGNDSHLIRLYPIFDNFLDINNIYFNELMDAIDKNKDELANKINGINKEPNYKDIDLFFILFKNKDVCKAFVDFVKNETELINILFLLVNNDYDIDKNEKEVLISSLINFLKKYIDTFSFIPDFIDTDKNQFFEEIGDYIKNNNDFLMTFLELIKDNKNLLKIINKTIDDISIQQMCNYAYKNIEEIEYIYEICNNDTELLEALTTLIGKNEDKEFLIEYLLSNEVLSRYPNLISSIIGMGMNLVLGEADADSFFDLLFNMTKGATKAFLKTDYDRIDREISKECLGLINYTILGNFSFDNNLKLSKNISKFFVYKSLIDTTKNPNDLLTYDNCLKKPPILEVFDIKNIQDFGVVPAFILATLDDTVNGKKNEFKNTTQLEKCYFVSSICLPQGIDSGKNKDTYLHCTEEDYSHLFKYIFNIFFDTSNIEIKPVVIKKNQSKTEKINGWIIGFVKLLPFYILLVPFILYIIIIIFKKGNNEEEENNNKDNSKDQIENEGNKKRKNSRWIIYIDEFFNFLNNGEELFNFELIKTKCYDNKGINNNYIGGLLGISIILTILGQIYLILYNLPMKEFGQQNFFNLFNSPLYILFFIGLRYSPRIIFSCSGYILSLKYLSYINKDLNHYFFNFISRQIYKYLMLILIILFMRHSYYHLVTLFGIRPIFELFNQNVLMIPESTKDFLLCLLTLKSFQYNKIDSRVRHYLTDFFWMPINEIFFFIFGAILIKIGYKFKLKIDYAILFLIISLYLGKIGWYYYVYKKEKIYTTLYYYMFDYGDFMLNPIFNLSYYLIGMYFGLLNFCKEKGVSFTIEKEENINNDEDQNENENENNKDEIMEDFSDNNRKTFGSNDSFIGNLGELKDDLNSIKNEENDKNSLDQRRKYSSKEKKSKELVESLINKKKGNKSINNSILNVSKDVIDIIKNMPFLKLPAKIRDKHLNSNYCIYFLVIIFSLIILFLACIHFIFIAIYKEPNITLKSILKELSLENIITNKILNHIYLFDIELVVLSVQWGFSAVYTMAETNSIISFFGHKYWLFCNKFYFSFILVCNATILFIFYESETVVKLNSYNLLLFFFIDTIFIFAFTLILYITVELPLKRIFKYLLSNDYEIKFQEEDKN